MASLLVVIIVGGALAAITKSSLDAAQPATARPGGRSAALLHGFGHDPGGQVLSLLRRIASIPLTRLLHLAPRRGTGLLDPGEAPLEPALEPVADDAPAGDTDLATLVVPTAEYDTDCRVGLLCRGRALVGYVALVAVLGAVAALLLVVGAAALAAALQSLVA